MIAINNRVFGIPSTQVKHFPRLKGFVEKMERERGIVTGFLEDMPRIFWRLVPDRYALKAALKVYDLNLSRVPDGHVLEDKETKIDRSIGSAVEFPAGMRSYVYRDFRGSLLRIFQGLSDEHWEIRYVKNFGSSSSEGFALTHIFTKGAARNVRTRYHCVIEIAEAAINDATEKSGEYKDLIDESDIDLLKQKKAEVERILQETEQGTYKINLQQPGDVEDLRKAYEAMLGILSKKQYERVLKALKDELPAISNTACQDLVKHYFENTLPQIYLTLDPIKLAVFVKYFKDMDRQVNRISVCSPRPEDLGDRNNKGGKGVKTIIVAIKEEKITALLAAICKKLR